METPAQRQATRYRSVILAAWFDPSLWGTAVTLGGLGLSSKPYGPLNLDLPPGHTGILTGLVEVASFTDQLPQERQENHGGVVFLQVAWDDRPEWNHEYCGHGDYCLVDLHMKSDRAPLNQLQLADGSPAGRLLDKDPTIIIRNLDSDPVCFFSQTPRR